MLDKSFKENQMIYGASIALTAIVSIIYALSNTALNVPLLTKLVDWLPFYDKGLGWIMPAIFGMVLGFVLKVFKERSYSSEVVISKEGTVK